MLTKNCLKINVTELIVLKSTSKTITEYWSGHKKIIELISGSAQDNPKKSHHL